MRLSVNRIDRISSFNENVLDTARPCRLIPHVIRSSPKNKIMKSIFSNKKRAKVF